MLLIVWIVARRNYGQRQTTVWVFVFLFLFFWPYCMTCRILVPQPGIKPGPLAATARRPNHWTTREFPQVFWRWRMLIISCHVQISSNLAGIQKWFWQTKKFVWLTLLMYLLYCCGLEPNLQYLWGLPVSHLLYKLILLIMWGINMTV